MAFFVECAAKNDSKDEKNDCVSFYDSVPWLLKKLQKHCVVVKNIHMGEKYGYQ